tara:strand:- start:456 stop:1478 length:1023 start_codon:yes stop_codon:yes gene_type:complete
MSIARLMQQAAAGGVASTPEPDFLMTVTTTTSSETFTIPCQNVGTFNCTVDWGDSSTSTITAYNDADLAHTYATAGDYQIRINGTFPNINFNNVGDKLKVKSVENLGTVGWLRLDSAFQGCLNLTSFVVGDADTSSVTDMNEMLRDCETMTTLDLTNLNTSSVTSMERMFYRCEGMTTIDVTGFDTSNCTTMSSMFFDCQTMTTVDVTGFNTSSCTHMGSMFSLCVALTTVDVSGFDTSAVTNMIMFFRNCSSLTDIVGVDDFDITSLTDVNSLFYFAFGVTLPTSRYDSLLVKWDAQSVPSNKNTTFGSSTYTGGGTAAAARANLISTDGWTISDGGIA